MAINTHYGKNIDGGWIIYRNSENVFQIVLTDDSDDSALDTSARVFSMEFYTPNGTTAKVTLTEADEDITNDDAGTIIFTLSLVDLAALVRDRYFFVIKCTFQGLTQPVAQSYTQIVSETNPGTTLTSVSMPVNLNGITVNMAVTLAGGGAPLASPTFTGVPTVPTAAVGTDTLQVANTAYVRANAMGKATSTIYTSGNAYKAFQNLVGPDTNDKAIEILNIGYTGHGGTDDIHENTTGLVRINGRLVMIRNMQWDQVNAKWLTPIKTASAYGSAAMELGGEAVILHATPEGVDFNDVPHEILMASANGTDGPANAKQTSGYYVHIKAPLWARYSSAAYDPATTANSWNPSTATDPLIWLSTGEDKGTALTHDYLELMKVEGNTVYGVINFARSGGTHASKTITTTGALQGAIGAKGWDGSTWQRTAEISFHTRGTMAAGSIPMGILFRSSTSNTASLATRIEMAPNGHMGFNVIGADAQTALVHIGASTTARASLRINKGVAPTAPNDGDIWYDDSAETLHVRINGVTKTFTLS